MEPSIDTTDVREPRPFKINAYVHPDRVAYLKKLEYPKKILRYIFRCLFKQTANYAKLHKLPQPIETKWIYLDKIV